MPDKKGNSISKPTLTGEDMAGIFYAKPGPMNIESVKELKSADGKHDFISVIAKDNNGTKQSFLVFNKTEIDKMKKISGDKYATADIPALTISLVKTSGRCKLSTVFDPNIDLSKIVTQSALNSLGSTRKDGDTPVTPMIYRGYLKMARTQEGAPVMDGDKLIFRFSQQYGATQQGKTMYQWPGKNPATGKPEWYNDEIRLGKDDLTAHNMLRFAALLTKETQKGEPRQGAYVNLYFENDDARKFRFTSEAQAKSREENDICAYDCISPVKALGVDFLRDSDVEAAKAIVRIEKAEGMGDEEWDALKSQQRDEVWAALTEGAVQRADLKAEAKEKMDDRPKEAIAMGPSC